jgi:NAD(P)-dependent dehydrogenase (short-subunit alcohol dehydrogenase family)
MGERAVAAVVGDGAGLGVALARRFAAGYKVALVDRSAEVIGEVTNEIRAAGGIASPVQCDATIEAEIATAHEAIRNELGPIDVLIYNGGRRPIWRLMETTPEVFEQTWRLHALGTFLWSRQVVPEMRNRHAGRTQLLAAGKGRRPAQAGRDRRCVLVSRTPGSKHVDARARRTTVQGEVLSARGRRTNPPAVRRSP